MLDTEHTYSPGDTVRIAVAESAFQNRIGTVKEQDEDGEITLTFLDEPSPSHYCFLPTEVTRVESPVGTDSDRWYQPPELRAIAPIGTRVKVDDGLGSGGSSYNGLYGHIVARGEGWDADMIQVDLEVSEKIDRSHSLRIWFNAEMLVWM